MKLSNDAISYMRIKKTFRNNTKPINSIDISTDGEFLMTSSLDESIHLYSCFTGELKQKIMCMKYGVDLTRFLPSTNEYVIHASSNGWDETIRHLNTTQSAYLRYYKGHRGKVLSISVSNQDEAFISSSMDDTVRLWDVRISECQGLLHLNAPRISYDPVGMIFAAATRHGGVKLFDSRKFDAGPFQSWKIDSRIDMWKDVSFSLDGKMLLCSSEDGSFYVLDSFTGDLVMKHKEKDNNTCAATFPPRSDYILKGDNNGKIVVYDTESGRDIEQWVGYEDPVFHVKWNHKLMMVASASTQISFWYPDKDIVV